MKKRRVYLDYGAAGPVDVRVVQKMIPYFRDVFGNASSLHGEGVRAKRALEEARAESAERLGVHADEIIFTSGGTESNNIAIFGAVRAREEAGMSITEMHFITSAIEHPSVMDCFSALEKRGASVTYVGVSADGLIDPKELASHITAKTVLISIGYANSEIGVIQPLSRIAKDIRQRAQAMKIEKPLFHTDASQALLFFSCRPAEFPVDLMTLDGQKIRGPKGIGVLYRRRGSVLARLFEGGGQEGGLRPGTENISAIVGFTEALRLLSEKEVREKESKKMLALRDYFLTHLAKKIPEAEVNGSLTERLPNNINISIPKMDGEYLVLALDARGFACGTGSACLASKGDASYVIGALGKGEEMRAGTLRFSFGPDTEEKDIARLIEELADIVRIQKSI